MSIFADFAQPNTGFGKHNVSGGESLGVVNNLEPHKRREMHFPSFSEYRSLSISDAEPNCDRKYVYRRRTRSQHLRMQERLNAQRRRELVSDPKTHAFDTLARNFHFSTNRREEIQDAEFDAPSDGHDQQINLQDKTHSTLSLNEPSGFDQRGPIGDWRQVHDNWNPGLYVPDRQLPKERRDSLILDPPTISRSLSEEGDDGSSAGIPRRISDNVREYVKMNEEYHSSQRLGSIEHARFQGRQDVQDLKENDIIIIKDRAISAEYDDEDEASRSIRRLSYKVPITATEQNGLAISTRNTVAFRENYPSSAITNRQETIRRLERGERPLLEQKEIVRRTAQAYQRLPEVKERRKIEQKKEEAEYRRQFVREMDARRRGKLL